MFQLYKKLVYSEKNIVTIGKNFAELLRVPITTGTLRNSLENHPSYPSLLSLSDVLNSFNIPNWAFNLPLDKLNELSEPCVALIKDPISGADVFSIIRNSSNNHVTYFEPDKNKYVTVTQEKFASVYKNVVLVANVNVNSGQKNYRQALHKEFLTKVSLSYSLFIIPFLAIIYCILTLIRGEGNALLSISHFLFSLIGMGIAGLLIWYEIDDQNSVLQEVCGKKSKKRNCNSVLTSNGSSIFGFSWSLLGFCYFCCLLITQIMADVMGKDALFFSSWIHILVAGYIPFSLYYQKFIVKKWCVLCLGVQGVLFMQLLIILLWRTNIAATSFSWPIFVMLSVNFLLPLAIIVQLIPLLKQNQLLKRQKFELAKLKYNEDVFNAILKKQRQIIGDTNELGITIGNPDAKNTIVMICNPYCRPCSNAHIDLERLISSNLNVNVQIIFSAANERSSFPVKHILAIAKNENEKTLKKALDYWHNANVKNYEIFGKEFPVKEDLEKQNDEVDRMNSWCKSMQIRFTPTFFINGYEMPEGYQLKDIEHFFY
ncbi:vitamin K epoxide reductase family protein [Olivibacter sp. CPCC 100613]|uniref:vitamin K epoxide reductase family protein n=1 Tax=Olivibacter sp. CPCC 100613 TaxID=3079931 RepID=UPI002FF5D215